MDFRTDESCNFKRRLGFNLHYVTSTKQQTITETIKEVSEGENIQTKCKVLNYRIDLYFHDYKLAIETDEFRDYDEDKDYGKKKRKKKN